MQLCKIKSSKSFGQRLSGGVYKGIPNGLKQSRPGKLCEFTVYTIRCCLPVTGPLLPNQDKWTEMAKVTNPGKRRNAWYRVGPMELTHAIIFHSDRSSLADARVCYGQVKKLRWDDDDSIVKHKLATMAVRE